VSSTVGHAGNGEPKNRQSPELRRALHNHRPATRDRITPCG
jgi:hypothetical protein